MLKIDEAMTPEELELMLSAGEGLFWERDGDELKLHSPEMVAIGIEAMWDMWQRIDGLIVGGRAHLVR